MNPSNLNLFDTLFSDHDDNDEGNNVGLEILNSMYNSLNTEDICNYHDLSSYISIIPAQNMNYLIILQINARSMNKNYDNLLFFLKSLPKLPDILSISETWLNSTSATLHEIHGFKSYHTHRPGGRGGVAIYINSSIPSKQLNEYCFCDENVELCTVSIKFNNLSYTISSLYRPHDKHHKVNEFITFIENLLSQNIFLRTKTITTGDFNTNLLEHQTPPPNK